MPSALYRLMEFVVRRSGAREKHGLTGKTAERAFLEAARGGPAEPWEPDAGYARSVNYQRVEIAGCPCYRIRSYELPPTGPSEAGALLYLNGGGFMQPPSKRDFALAARLAQQTSRELWLLCYPLEPRARMHEIVDCVLATYRAMLEEYEPDHTTLFGLSSGACLCLYLLNRISHEGTGDPLPERLVLNSPVVELPPTAEQLARMQALDKLDCALPASYFGPTGTISLMLRQEPAEHLYLSRVLEANMQGWPPVILVYGTQETPYAFEPDLVQALRAAHVPYELIEVPGCGHCTILYWPAHEARELLRREVAAIASPAGAAAGPRRP